MTPVFHLARPALVGLALLASGLAADPATDCLALAGSPLDPALPDGIAGVAPDAIDIALARPACETALSDLIAAGQPTGQIAFTLGRVYTGAGNNDLALGAYRMAEVEGNPLGISNLGVMYERGLGVEIDLPHALANFMQAGQGGLWIGYHNANALIFDNPGLDPGGALRGEAVRALMVDGTLQQREIFVDLLVRGAIPELHDGEREEQVQADIDAGNYFGPYALAQQLWAAGSEGPAARHLRTAWELAGTEPYEDSGYTPRQFVGWLIQDYAAQGAKFTSAEVAAVREAVGPVPEE